MVKTKKQAVLPLVSVVIPTFNNGKFIGIAIKSVLSQTYKNLEVVLIDDDSSDNTKNIVERFLKKDKRIKYYKNKKNIGFVASLNKGIKVSTGDYIARLDSDDVWLSKDKLSMQIAHFQNNPATILVGTWGYKINSKGKNTAQLKYPMNDKNIRRYLLIENCFIHSSVVFRKNDVIYRGGYDNDFRSAEDYELWLRLGQFGEFYNINKEMVGYRTNTNGISMNRYSEQIANTIKAVNKYKTSYPFYFLSLPLWYARKVFPRELRENLSSKVRKNMTLL